jgi:hypothetical protein
VNLSGLEIIVRVDPTRRNDIIVSLTGDSGAGQVPAVRRSVFLRSDANGDGGVDLGDAVFTLTHQFLGGSDPVGPFPDCGVSELENELPCERSSCLQ